jgi:hypothetical protein
MATPAMASRAIEAAHAFFPEWSRTDPAMRVAMLRRVAQIVRSRKMEFDAWLVYEAGKSWPEAEADVSEAIDFCEYYALEMERLSGPQPVSQLPGEKGELRYIPLGAGLIIPPWNFPLAILAGILPMLYPERGQQMSMMIQAFVQKSTTRFMKPRCYRGISCESPEKRLPRRARSIEQRQTMPEDLETYARDLFAILRELDSAGVEGIFVEGVPQEGLGLTIMDRLRRAAS